MTLALYEVAENYVAALRTLESLLEAGTLTQEVVSDTLEGLSGDMEVKVKNVVAYTKNIEAEADAIRAAIDKMKARMKALDSKSEWLRDYILQNMKRTQIKEIKTPYYVIRLRDNPAHVVIDNEAGLPADCWRTIPERREVDKAAIKARLSLGEVMQCAHLEKDVRLEIK